MFDSLRSRLGLGSTHALVRAAESIPQPVEVVPHRFEVDIDPGVLFGTYPAPTTPIVPKVSRREAMSVPAVKRSRDLICVSLGSLPLDLIGPDKSKTDWSLFRQPEADVPRSVTFTRTFEDMLLEGVAWWRIVAWGWHNKPVEVVRLDPRSINVQKDSRVYYNKAGQSQGTSYEWIPDEELIRFDSPNDPLLQAGARAIRACIELDQAALRYSEGNQPLDYFTPTDGYDPGDDEEVTELLNAWKLARQQGVTGYIPASLKYNTAGWNPEQLQMAEARQHAVLEIARLAGVDPEELGVSTTSRTYANQFDRRKSFIDFTLGGYRQAFEDRLSMDQVSPRGYSARLDLSDFLRSDDKTRMEIAQIGKTANILRTAEARDLYGISPADVEVNNPQPAQQPQEVPNNG